MVTDPEPEALTTSLGSLTFELYRGPSDHNSPKANERTLEVALGLWFMRRSLSRLSSIGQLPLELGDVLGHYWPTEDRVDGRYLPWQLADLGSNGQDATSMSFVGRHLLSLSTVEHVGHDNEGLAHVNGFRTNGTRESLEEWVRSWDEAPSLLRQIAAEAAEFLVTFPVGFNARLDDVVVSSQELWPVSRVLRRVNVQNLWEEDPKRSFAYHYDLQDAYLPETTGLMHHPALPGVYQQVYGSAMPAKLQPPFHPRFRFANAVCVVTNGGNWFAKRVVDLERQTSEFNMEWQSVEAS
ncbi:HERC1 [Symbiodinium natans]|uniref:HERC1 protein n=1 Tax=Symbiodinium natans TaxID=878477 RepID=A0A812UBY3_9DINO|nr:HERC1 [Symbiodinium natans]